MPEANVAQLWNYGRKGDDDTYHIAIRCLGSYIHIELPDHTWIDDLVQYLPPGWQPAEPEDHTPPEALHRPVLRVAVYRDGTGRDKYSATMRKRLADNLGKRIENAVAERSEDYVFIHAGAVVVDGQALILPGESFAGKSTLVAALVNEGAQYFSDEYAVITEKGMVLPFARQIALRNSLIYPAGRTDLATHVPDLAAYPAGLQARQVLFLAFEAEGCWAMEPIDRTSALIELCKNTVEFRQRPDMSFLYLNRMLDNTVSFWKGTRGGAEEAARRILAQF